MTRFRDWPIVRGLRRFKSKLRKLCLWLSQPAERPLFLKPTRSIAVQYFAEHPKAKDGVMKAYYAYHAPHFRLEPKGHNFTGGSRESQCVWCGRSREMVRHDDLSPECQYRPVIQTAEDIILHEEEKTFALLKKAEVDVPKLVGAMGMSGSTLAILHHTYGYDPETVAGVISVPPEMIAEYHTAMEKERDRSRARQKKTVLTVA